MIDLYESATKILDSLTEQITVINMRGDIVYVNQSWINFSDNNEGSIDRDNWNRINYLDVCDSAGVNGDTFGVEASAGIRSVISGEEEVFYLEYPCHSPSKERWFMMRVTSLEFSSEENYYVLSHQKITERKLAEEALSKNYLELKKTHKLMISQSRQAAMGEMTSMLAHQWRQPLTAISAITGSLSLELMMDNCKKETFTEGVDEIHELAQDLSCTIDNFRDFFKPDEVSEAMEIHVPLIKALDIIKVSLESDGIQVVEDYESQEKVNLYSNDMMQVILNILKNSQDNFKERAVDNPQVSISTHGQSISISDNGGGISDDIIDNIYEPYFTTKNVLNGTGLGLYISKIIVENHHKGSIKTFNTDYGVCFKIELA